jgi:hypothetical protein
MKMPSLGTLSFAAVGVAAVVLIAIGAPHDRPAPTPVATSSPSPSSVSAGGFTLVSDTVELPIDDQQYPDGPHADVINANCTACHSASMALNQPPLSADQWRAEVSKMRDTYKAPVPTAAMSDIVAYLTAMSAQQGESVSKTPMKQKAAADDSGGTG